MPEECRIWWLWMDGKHRCVCAYVNVICVNCKLLSTLQAYCIHPTEIHISLTCERANTQAKRHTSVISNASPYPEIDLQSREFSTILILQERTHTPSYILTPHFITSDWHPNGLCFAFHTWVHVTPLWLTGILCFEKERSTVGKSDFKYV